MSILSGKKFFISDVDGTIFDRMPLFTRVFAEVCKKRGVNQGGARRHYIQTAGDILSDQFKKCFSGEGVKYTLETIKECEGSFLAKVKDVPAPLFPGARETLTRLHEEGIMLFATSGSNEDELKTLFAFNLLPPFALILGSDRIPKGAEHIREFAKHVSLTVKKFAALAIMVGDGPTDMRIASEANILGVGVTTTTTAEALLEAGARQTIPLLSSIFTI